MRNKLCLVLSMVLIVCLSVPAMCAFATIPDFSFRVFDNSGVSGAVIDGVACEVTGHKMYAYISDLYPGYLKTTVKWSSSKSSVASVSSKGVITCKKQGFATIRAKVKDKKTGDWRQKSFYVGILKNATNYTGMPSSFIHAAQEMKAVVGSPLEIYIKGGDIYAKMYVYNGSTTVLKESVSLDIAYWPEFGNGIAMEDAVRLGIRKVNLAASIPPNMQGKTKEFKIGKPAGFKASRDYLLDAYLIAAGSSGKSTVNKALAPLVRKLPLNAKGVLNLDKVTPAP